MRRYSIYAMIPVAAALTLSLLAGCSRQGSNRTHAPPALPVPVGVMTLKPVQIPDYEIAPGTVVPAQQVQIASRLMGFVHSLDVHEGQMVKAGQLLFTVDPADVLDQVRQAQANVAQTQAAFAEAQTDYRRFEDLYRQGAVPRRQFDKVRLQYQVTRSQLAAAQARLRTARSQLRYSEVRAPISGVVVQKLAHNGDLAAPGRPLLVLENAAHLQVRTDVSGAVYRRLVLGAEVQVAADGKTVTGRVERIVPAADPVTHTYQVKIGLPPDSGLRSGAYASVKFPVGTHQGLVVPRDAVLDRAGIAGVFVIDAQGIAHYRMVRAGAPAPGGVEIRAGLYPDDRVVIAPPDALDNGMRVTVAAGGGRG